VSEEQIREIVAVLEDMQVKLDQADLRTQAIQRALKDVGIPSREEGAAEE
jgi:hypothetical protein